MIRFDSIISKNIFKIFYTFVFITSFLTDQVCSEWNTRDYMKREHSLLKPYQGKIIFDKIRNTYFKF